MMVYLNAPADYKGCETVFLTENDAADAPPLSPCATLKGELGEGLIFAHNVWHEVRYRHRRTHRHTRHRHRHHTHTHTRHTHVHTRTHRERHTTQTTYTTPLTLSVHIYLLERVAELCDAEIMS